MPIPNLDLDPVLIILFYLSCPQTGSYITTFTHNGVLQLAQHAAYQPIEAQYSLSSVHARLHHRQLIDLHNDILQQTFRGDGAVITRTYLCL